jgi:hypothetical protein
MTRMPGGKKGWNCSICGSAHISPPEPHFNMSTRPPSPPVHPPQPPEMVIAEVPCALCTTARLRSPMHRTTSGAPTCNRTRSAALAASLAKQVRRAGWPNPAHPTRTIATTCTMPLPTCAHLVLNVNWVPSAGRRGAILLPWECAIGSSPRNLRTASLTRRCSAWPCVPGSRL